VPVLAFLTPRLVGHAMFVGVVAFLLVMQVTAFRRAVSHPSRFAAERAWLCATALVLTGLTSFAMGVFIVGTHERHMAHAFPFLLLGVVTLHHCDRSSRSRAQLAVAVVAAAVYGGVVYAVLRRAASLDLRLAAGLDLRLAAVVLLGTFVALVVGYTGTMLAHGRRRAHAGALPGDGARA
jgi:hypothetical protein